SVAFSPAASIKAPAYRVTAVAAGSGEVLKTWENTLSGSSPQTISIDLAGITAGAVRLSAELLSDNRPLDRAEQLVGLIPPATTVQTKPDPSADWRKLAEGKSLIYVGMNKGPLKDPATRIAKVKELLNEASAVSNLIEYEFNWAHVEPMPGVFDWSEIDAVVDYAKQKGQSVLLWPTFIGGEPEWIPPYFQRLADGTVSGTRSYLFQGGRINYWHSPELKEHILRLCRAMALRYRGNPTVHGYYLIVEHGGDNPWFGFFPGYEPETLADYHAYLKNKYPTIASLGSAWGRPVAGWDVVSVPAPEASDRERLDWNQFRRSRLGDFFVKAVREIRALDPYKLMMIYTGAADGDSAVELAKLGTILADGGAASPIAGGPTTMGYAAAGLGRRTEEISVGQWGVLFPTQLDATLFNLTLGGGRNANAKMFFTPGKPFSELRTPRIALDRFLRFIPIWQALAPTEPMPWEAFMLKDVPASMLLTKSTAGFDDAHANMVALDSHVLTPAVPMSLAKQGKLLFLQPRFTSYETGMHDEIADYVKSGGTLVLCANSARFSPDLPDDDWVLLKRLGIAPPVGKLLRSGALSARSDAGTFSLRDAWRAPESDATVLATFEATGTPAITRHRVGKGTVNLIWTNAIIPPSEGGGHPFFRELADAAGVARHSDASIPQLWTNLLRNRETGDHYGTVYHAVLNKPNAPAVTGATLWNVPPGDYAVTELISGRDLGVKSAKELRVTGLETSLGALEVAIYHFKKR
ncbi:MAG: beta-galactosidase, partial [Rariglobus sp.]